MQTSNMPTLTAKSFTQRRRNKVLYRNTVLENYPRVQLLPSALKGYKLDPETDVLATTDDKSKLQTTNEIKASEHDTQDIPPRRSFFTREQRREMLAKQEAHYPASALRNPYIQFMSVSSSNNFLLSGVSEITRNDNSSGHTDRLHKPDDMTPLHVAAGTGDVENLMRCLKVFDINCIDREGRTPLIYAVIGEHNEIIQILHKRHAMLNIVDHDGRTALHWAAFYGRHDILQQLVKMSTFI